MFLQFKMCFKNSSSLKHPPDPQLGFITHALHLLFEKLNLLYKKTATAISAYHEPWICTAPLVKSREVLHANLLKIAYHHCYSSKNLTTSSEQRYGKIHLNGSFWGKFLKCYFSKTTVKKYSFIRSYHDVTLKEQIFMAFLSKHFRKKYKNTELTLNFVQKQYFGDSIWDFFAQPALSFNQITKLWSKNLGELKAPQGFQRDALVGVKPWIYHFCIKHI